MQGLFLHRPIDNFAAIYETKSVTDIQPSVTLFYLLGFLVGVFADLIFNAATLSDNDF